MFTLEDNLPFPAFPIERVAPDMQKERMKKIGHSKAKVLFTLGFRERETEKEVRETEKEERGRERQRKKGERESVRRAQHSCINNVFPIFLIHQPFLLSGHVRF